MNDTVTFLFSASGSDNIYKNFPGEVPQSEDSFLVLNEYDNSLALSSKVVNTKNSDIPTQLKKCDLRGNKEGISDHFSRDNLRYLQTKLLE